MGSERGKGRGKETKEQCIRQQLTENAVMVEEVKDRKGDREMANQEN